MEPSKAFRLNLSDSIKAAKSLGICLAALGAVIVLGWSDVIDVDLKTAIYTSFGAWVVNWIKLFIAGQLK